MQCPYCEASFVLAQVGNLLNIADKSVRDGAEIRQKQIPLVRIFRGAYCPNCLGTVVAMYHQKYAGNDSSPVKDGPESFAEYVFPRNRVLKALPPEVPSSYREDYDEAAVVLPASAKASAALSRRLLQRVLHDHYGIKEKFLSTEIKSFLAKHNPPTYVAEPLDAVRNVGNFGAHPIKDELTGVVMDVEPGEADWLLVVLESLFDYAFVQPVKQKQRIDAMNAKLAAAGQKPMLQPPAVP